MTVLPELNPTTVTIRPSDLLEAGCVALESRQHQQCRTALHKITPSGETMHCAEGIFATLLIAAWPERFGFSVTGGFHDRNGWFDTRGDHVPRFTSAILLDQHWELLHPRGPAIAGGAAARLGHYSLFAANDDGVPFARIAQAIRDARAAVEGETR